jgi:hypothetical protein
MRWFQVALVLQGVESLPYFLLLRGALIPWLLAFALSWCFVGMLEFFWRISALPFLASTFSRRGVRKEVLDPCDE